MCVKMSDILCYASDALTNELYNRRSLMIVDH